MDTKNAVLEIWLKLGQSIERLKNYRIEENVLHLFWAARLLRDAENACTEKLAFFEPVLDLNTLDIMDVRNQKDLEDVLVKLLSLHTIVGRIVDVLEKGGNVDSTLGFCQYVIAFDRNSRRLRDLGFSGDAVTGRLSSKGTEVQSVLRSEFPVKTGEQTLYKMGRQLGKSDTVRESIENDQFRPLCWGKKFEADALECRVCGYQKSCNEQLVALSLGTTSGRSDTSKPNISNLPKCVHGDTGGCSTCTWESSKRTAESLWIDTTLWGTPFLHPVPTTKPCGEIPSAEAAPDCYGRLHSKVAGECQTCAYKMHCSQAQVQVKFSRQKSMSSNFGFLYDPAHQKVFMEKYARPGETYDQVTARLANDILDVSNEMAEDLEPPKKILKVPDRHQKLAVDLGIWNDAQRRASWFISNARDNETFEQTLDRIAETRGS